MLRDKVIGVILMMRRKMLPADGEVRWDKMEDGEVAMNPVLVLNGTLIYPESLDREARRDRRRVVIDPRASSKCRSAMGAEILFSKLFLE